MAQLISCPECKKQLQVPDDLLGKTVQCPECGHMFAAAPAVEKPAESWSKPSSPRSDEERPREKPRYDDDDDDRPSRRSPSISRGGEKPGKVQGLGVMALVGGIFAILVSLSIAVSLGAATCGLGCLWPAPYYGLIIGILAVVKGSALLGNEAYKQAPPTGTAVMLIINIINFDIVGMTLGIVMLVFCSDQEVKEYLAK